MTPYTTKSGVKIGIRYMAPPPRMYRDEELLQAALLGIKTPKVPSLIWLSVVVLICYLFASLIASSV